MSRYLVDANLPYYFSVWRGEAYEHVIDIDPCMKDSQIWEYAKNHDLTIITKDADFSDRMLLSNPPPRVIHIRLGNMKIKAFYNMIQPIWEEVLLLSQRHKLGNVYADRIEGIG